MRSAMGLILAFVLFMAAAPAYSAEVLHVFRCEQEDDANEEAIIAIAQEWLAAARKSKGGQGMQLEVYFPLAVNSPGDIDFLMALTSPSAEQWGVFWDNFHDSPVSEVDARMDEMKICPDSALWEVEKIEVKPQ